MQQLLCFQRVHHHPCRLNTGALLPPACSPLPQAAGQAGAALDSIRWGSDYLLKVHKALPDTNQSMLVTRVRRRRGASS